MRVEFRQGVPQGCVEWLWDNIGSGNIYGNNGRGQVFKKPCKQTDAWFYERISKPIIPEAFDNDPFEYVPTITVYDEKQAVMFALKWSM